MRSAAAHLLRLQRVAQFGIARTHQSPGAILKVDDERVAQTGRQTHECRSLPVIRFQNDGLPCSAGAFGGT